MALGRGPSRGVSASGTRFGRRASSVGQPLGAERRRLGHCQHRHRRGGPALRAAPRAGLPRDHRSFTRQRQPLPGRGRPIRTSAVEVLRRRAGGLAGGKAPDDADGSCEDRADGDRTPSAGAGEIEPMIPMRGEMAVKVMLAVAIFAVMIPSGASAERAKSPADATVFVRLVGSVHAEVEENGVKRTEDLARVEIGTGSGFVISPFGYVLTNDHVVSNSELIVTRGAKKAKLTLKVSRIEVCFPAGVSAARGLSSPCAEASVAASDPTLDLAVLLISAANLPYVALGDSDVVTAGLPVDALGYPFGRELEVGKVATAPDLVPEISTTSGTISAMRDSEGLADTSPFRSRVESDAKSVEVALRIDRVFSPWNPKQIEQALVSSQAFERVSTANGKSEMSSRPGDAPLLLGHATGTDADSNEEIRIDYAVLDLGAEKLVARYIGPAEAIAFNESALRESLASLEGQRFLVGEQRVSPRPDPGPR